jgi:hypothetical protein
MTNLMYSDVHNTVYTEINKIVGQDNCRGLKISVSIRFVVKGVQNKVMWAFQQSKLEKYKPPKL